MFNSYDCVKKFFVKLIFSVKSIFILDSILFRIPRATGGFTGYALNLRSRGNGITTVSIPFENAYTVSYGYLLCKRFDVSLKHTNLPPSGQLNGAYRA